jgi:2-polyprenyl-6-hydroxyphenyl methylase/3-demethylubiquinone-9 3-methyltransferase
MFVLALYRKTPFCGVWRWEKRIYSGAPPAFQMLIRFIYKALFLAGKIATGASPSKYIRDYNSNRGMNWHHDVHDWLGGYPYESTLPDIVESSVAKSGFATVRLFDRRPVLAGLFGAPCFEQVLERRSTL